MDMGKIGELKAQYAKCPQCKSRKTSDGNMSYINLVFRRYCKCGFSIELHTDEDGNVIDMNGNLLN